MHMKQCNNNEASSPKAAVQTTLSHSGSSRYSYALLGWNVQLDQIIKYYHIVVSINITAIIIAAAAAQILNIIRPTPNKMIRQDNNVQWLGIQTVLLPAAGTLQQAVHFANKVFKCEEACDTCPLVFSEFLVQFVYLCDVFLFCVFAGKLPLFPKAESNLTCVCRQVEVSRVDSYNQKVTHVKSKIGAGGCLLVYCEH